MATSQIDTGLADAQHSTLDAGADLSAHEGLEQSIYADFDARLSRLDTRIADERQAMSELFRRLSSAPQGRLATWDTLTGLAGRL